MADRAPEADLARLRALLLGADSRRLAEAEARIIALEARIGEAPAPSAPGEATLPEFASKAEDLEALKKTVDDAASIGGGLWLSYLLALFYLMVAAGSVTHADLFFEKPINLLLLNVQLPIVAFFALAPLLFLALHAYTLSHLVMLTEKAKRFHKALYTQIGPSKGMTAEEKDRRKRVRDGLRAQLPSNVFVQFLAGPPELRDDGFGFALRAIGWSTLAFGPVLLFLLFQVQFLPHHSAIITWIHRFALVADLGLVWWLWGRILGGREAEERREARRPARLSWVWKPVGIAASVVAVLFSFALATYYGEGFAGVIARFDRAGVVASLHDKIFHSAVMEETRRRQWLLSDTLVLHRLDALDELKIADPERVKRKGYIFIAQDRELAGAEFQRANLARIDFTKAHLSHADLSDAQMDRVSLEGAHLEQASFDRAQLQGASLEGAQSQVASYYDAQLQGASFYAAHLQGASFFATQLQGASFNAAHLQGVSFFTAQLQAASFFTAQLQAASLRGAALQGASFEDTLLETSDLRQAFFWRSSSEKNVLLDLLFTPSQQTWGPFMSPIFGSEMVAWTNVKYEQFKNAIKAFPAGPLSEEALARIQVLDCHDEMRVSCNPDKAQNPPPEFVTWRDQLLAASVKEDVFRRALANSLRKLVCPGDKDTIYVVRGPGFLDRLGAAGAEAKPLIADLSDKSGKTCPVAAQLTDADRAKLAEIDAQATAPASP